jgi:uncharacterized LabA/DUF88 family protein
MRVAIFIDGGYLSKVLRQYGHRIDLGKFSLEIAGSREILRTYYYDCLPYQSSPPSGEEAARFSKVQSFHRALKSLDRYEVRLGRLAKRDDGFIQKGVDVLLSIDMVNLSAKGKIDEAILVAGDSDYVPAIKMVKDNGVGITLYYSGRVHDELLENCDVCKKLDQEFIDKVKKQ